MFNSIPAINSFAPTESSRPKMPQLPDFNKKIKKVLDFSVKIL